jgi:hypothetical protein
LSRRWRVDQDPTRANGDIAKTSSKWSTRIGEASSLSVQQLHAYRQEIARLRAENQELTDRLARRDERAAGRDKTLLNSLRGHVLNEQRGPDQPRCFRGAREKENSRQGLGTIRPGGQRARRAAPPSRSVAGPKTPVLSESPAHRSAVHTPPTGRSGRGLAKLPRPRVWFHALGLTFSLTVLTTL